MTSEDSKKDLGWKYGSLANPTVKNDVTCKFCGKVAKGGIHRLKQHLAGGFRNITACPKCPEHVKEEIRKYMSKKKSEEQMNLVLKDEEESANAINDTRGKRILRVGSSSNKKPRQVGMKPACCYEVKEEVELALRKHLNSIKHVVQEVMEIEPLIRKVVKEEVELALRKHLNSMKQNGGKEVHISESRSLQLKFLSNLSLPVFTGARIKGEGCSNIQVALVDAFTEQPVISGPESSAKVEIVVLEGDFDVEENDNWTVEEFKNNIVREREGKEPLLAGDAFLNLKEGIGLVGEICFTDNSSWTRSRRFRLGARVVDNTDGTRVREAKTESFIVGDHGDKKHHPPLLDDVWNDGFDSPIFSDIAVYDYALHGIDTEHTTLGFFDTYPQSDVNQGFLLMRYNLTMFLSSHKIGIFDYTQPSAPSPDIFSSIYSIGGASCSRTFTKNALSIVKAAQRRWTMIFSVIKWFSVRKSVNLKRTTPRGEIQRYSNVVLVKEEVKLALRTKKIKLARKKHFRSMIRKFKNRCLHRRIQDRHGGKEGTYF